MTGLVTASIWNTDLVDNLAYLKTQTDLIDDMTQTNVAGSRAVNTVYQNDSGGIRIACITLRASIGPTTTTTTGLCYCDNANPPTTVIHSMTVQNDTAGALNYDFPFTLVIPVNYYYKTSNLDSVVYWTEYDLH